MAVTPARLGAGTLGTSPTTVCTIGAGVTATIRCITITNRTASAIAASLWLVPSGASVDDANVLLSGVSIPANGFLRDDGIHVLGAGGTVVGQGSATGLTMTVEGAEVSA